MLYCRIYPRWLIRYCRLQHEISIREGRVKIEELQVHMRLLLGFSFYINSYLILQIWSLFKSVTEVDIAHVIRATKNVVESKDDVRAFSLAETPQPSTNLCLCCYNHNTIYHVWYTYALCLVNRSTVIPCCRHIWSTVIWLSRTASLMVYAPKLIRNFRLMAF